MSSEKKKWNRKVHNKMNLYVLEAEFWKSPWWSGPPTQWSASMNGLALNPIHSSKHTHWWIAICVCVSLARTHTQKGGDLFFSFYLATNKWVGGGWRAGCCDLVKLDNILRKKKNNKKSISLKLKCNGIERDFSSHFCLFMFQKCKIK